jgi:hypothetical protein
MENLRKGLVTASLSMALFVGGAVVAAAAQEHHGAAQQASPASVNENPASASAVPQSSPAATMPDQDNGMRQVPDKDDRAMQQGDRDRDAKAQDRDAMGSKEGHDLTKQEVKTWDSFLDSHPRIAEDLQKDPQRVNDPGFVSSHPELQSFLSDHPKVREELKENPSKVMNRENKYEKTEDKK